MLKIILLMLVITLCGYSAVVAQTVIRDKQERAQALVPIVSPEDALTIRKSAIPAR